MEIQVKVRAKIALSANSSSIIMPSDFMTLNEMKKRKWIGTYKESMKSFEKLGLKD